jgi:MFS family permease
LCFKFYISFGSRKITTLKNKRAILLLMLANSISGVAQGISFLAIPWYFTTLIHREELFTSIYLLVTGISLIWGIYAGTLVDKYNRKHIFLAVNVAGGIALTAASLTGYIHHGLHWAMIAMVFAVTVFIYNIHYPTLYGFAQEITPKERYGKVTSQLEIQGQLTWTLSGGIAAMLLNGVNGHINLFGAEVALPFTIRPWSIYEIFTIDAITYVLAFAMIWYIRFIPEVDRAADSDSLYRRIRTGMGYLKRHPVIFLFGNTSLFVFLTIIVHGSLINPIYVNSFLHKGGDVYALSDMVFSMGALLAGFVATRLFTQARTIPALIGLSVLAGLMYFVHVYTSFLPWYFLAYFMIGFCNSAGRVLRVTFLFQHIPNSVIGRTNSIFFVINVALRLMLTGLFALPLFHQGINIIWANAVLGAICIIGGVLIWMQKEDLEEMHRIKNQG